MLSKCVGGASVLVTINEWRPNYCPTSLLGTDGKVRHPPASLWDVKQQHTHTHTQILRINFILCATGDEKNRAHTHVLCTSNDKYFKIFYMTVFVWLKNYFSLHFSHENWNQSLNYTQYSTTNLVSSVSSMSKQFSAGNNKVFLIWLICY